MKERGMWRKRKVRYIYRRNKKNRAKKLKLTLGIERGLWVKDAESENQRVPRTGERARARARARGNSRAASS